MSIAACAVVGPPPDIVVVGVEKDGGKKVVLNLGRISPASTSL